MSDIIVRRATGKDAEAIAGLLTEVGQVHSDGRPDIYRRHITKHTARSAEAMIDGGMYVVYVAECDGNTVGELICKVMERKGDEFYRPRKWLYIDDLCVDDASRGSDAAPLLMGAAEEFARQHGCDSVELNCWAFNKRAMHFYEKMGYTPQKTEYEKLLRQ